MRKFPERDWKLFRSKIAGWQEAYMDRLCKEYIEILSNDADASKRFWMLDERIRDDRHRVGVTARMARSEMIYIIGELIRDGAICMDDLNDFSEELQEAIKLLVRLYDDDDEEIDESNNEE